MPFLGDEDRAVALQCFGLGMSQREVAQRLRLSRNTLQSWLSRGYQAKSGWQRGFYLDVIAAQAEYKRQVLAGLLAQTGSGGNIAAVQLALQRLDRIQKQQAAEDIPEDRLGARRYRLRDVRRRILDAGDTAYTKLMREERQLLVDIQQLEAEAEKRRKEEEDLRALTQDDAKARLRYRMTQLKDADLAELGAACDAELEERGIERGA